MATAESKFLEEVDDQFLICMICLERYQNAKLLPCLHTFCGHCLETLVKKAGELLCPVCRRPQTIADGGVRAIADNFFMNQLVEQFNERNEDLLEARKCGGCRKSSASHRCIDCAMSLCQTCSHVHSNIPLTRTHRLMSITQYEKTKVENPAAVQPPIYCTSHQDNQVKFYCDTCDIGICHECTILDHPRPQHKYRYLKAAAIEYKIFLTKMVKKMKVKEREVHDSKNVVQEMVNSVDNNFQKNEEIIKEHVTKAIEEATMKMMEDGKKLLNSLYQEHNDRKGKLHAQLIYFNNIENILTSACKVAGEMRQHRSDAKLMSAKSGMTSQIQELLTTANTDQTPLESDCVEFNPYHDYCQTESLGQLHLSSYGITHYSKFPKVGEEIRVTLTSKDQRVKLRKCDVNGYMLTPCYETMKVTMTDNSDGSISLNARGDEEGDYSLRVHVYDKPVQGSPLTLKVIPQKSKGLLCKFSRWGSKVDEVCFPIGVTLYKGNVLVCDQLNTRLQLFTLHGQHLKVIYLTNFPTPIQPACVAVSVKGHIFLTAEDSNQVFVCDVNGKLIGIFGENECKKLKGIAISPLNGRVYVADSEGKCVRVYTQNGNYVTSFTSQDSILKPNGITVDSNGNVIVTDVTSVKVFDGNGKYSHRFGASGGGLGKVRSAAYDVSTDKYGYMYVYDFMAGNINKYDPKSGQFISCIHNVTDGNSLGAICVTDDNPCKIVLSDHDGNCIKVFND
ncbi:tripartite motif-containing protein 2-like [Glandiceps talaboti]